MPLPSFSSVAAVGRLGQARIDQRPVQPAAGVVADGQGQRVGGVPQRRLGRRAGAHHQDVLLRHRSRLRQDVDAAGAAAPRGRGPGRPASPAQRPHARSTRCTNASQSKLPGRRRRRCSGRRTGGRSTPCIWSRVRARDARRACRGCCCRAGGRRSRCRVAWSPGHRPRLVLVHPDLFEDHLLLGVEVLAAQARPEDVGEDVHRLRQVLRQHRRVVDGVLLAGVGVVVRPDAVEVEVHVEGGPPRRALEHHVFEEVRHAGDLAASRRGSRCGRRTRPRPTGPTGSSRR